jgi:hypothetical protein
MKRSIYTVLFFLAFASYGCSILALIIMLALRPSGSGISGDMFIVPASMVMGGLLLHVLSAIGEDVCRGANALERMSAPPGPEEDKKEED